MTIHKKQDTLIIHVWPKPSEGLIAPDSKPISDEREADVLKKICCLTTNPDVRRKLLVMTCAIDEITAQLEIQAALMDRGGTCDTKQVEFLPLEEVERALWDAGKRERQTMIESIPITLSNTTDTRYVERMYLSGLYSALVIWHPRANDLKYLPYLKEQGVRFPIYIFHEKCHPEKWGVEIEGNEKRADRNSKDTLWDTQSTFDKEADLPWVIEGIAHSGESTWFGALPKQMKTWVLLCVSKALLTGEPLFNDSRYKANKAKKVIYLIPEASRASVKKRLKLLGLMGFLYDPITNTEGSLFVRTLSAGEKIKLTDPRLLEMVKDADVFLDTAIRWLEGEENKSGDVAVLSENIFNIIGAGARSVWCAHHAPKGFADASSMTLENMFRGSGEYGAALSNAYGLCQTDEKTSTLHFHAIVGRDLDGLIPDMILQGRPYLSTIGNFKVVNANAETYAGKKQEGKPEDPAKQQKIDFARKVEGSWQEKADAVNSEFKSAHDRSTIKRWVGKTDFDPMTKEELAKATESTKGGQ
jgi:AAA domain